MPPEGRVVLPGLKMLEVEAEDEDEDRSSVGRSRMLVDWRFDSRGEPEKMMR